MTPRTFATYRLGYSRTHVGQTVEANTSTPLAPFVPGREFVGNIDVGGLNRFGTQSSVDVNFLQHVISMQGDVTATRGRHLLKFGGLAERYLQDMVNPTFSLGTYSFANLRAFLENRATSFIGLTPQATFDRYWRFWLLGGYVQDELRLSDDSPHRRTALRSDDDARRYQRPRLRADQSDRSDRDHRPALRRARYEQHFAARRLCVECDGRRTHVSPRRLRHVLQHQQLAEPDRDGHQSAGDTARGVPEPDVSESAVRPDVGALGAADSVGHRDAATSRCGTSISSARSGGTRR